MFDVREKPRMVEKALLIGLQYADNSAEESKKLLEELEDLVYNMGVGVADTQIVKIREVKARFLMGTGKMQEILQHAKKLNADCIIFDDALTPAQQRNWEEESAVCVIDRQEVILDIFAMRAQTKEAVLQVALAKAEYALPRLKNAWTHLSRQRGGGSVQRGEGEAQIELDSRMVRTKIAKLKRELANVVKQRGVQRKQRLRVPLPTAAIVGYTNAGKSSLLNAMSGSDVLAADKLFATLDPTTRQILLPSGQKFLMTDTVGFVRRLPHRLVKAFKATLEETLVSDILIHVIDASNPEADAHSKTTLEVLKELGADESKIITVYNKIDLLPDEQLQAWKNFRKEKTFYISTHTADGLDILSEKLEEIVQNAQKPTELIVPHQRYDIISKLHEAGCIKEEKHEEEGVLLRCNIPERLEALIEPFLVIPKVKTKEPWED